MDETTFNQQLFTFLSHSPTPFHAVDTITKMLDKAGFRALDEKQEWQVEHRQPYYVVRDDGALVAFNLAEPAGTGIRIVGAHSDSPCLQIKPKPEHREKSYRRLGVEVYGGALLNPWFDRELSIAGRVFFRDSTNSIGATLIDFNRPVAVIPSLAIHLDREANDKKGINAQKDITLLAGVSGDEDIPFEEVLKQCVEKQHADSSPEEVLGHDLFCYDCRPPCYAGLENDFIVSSRLDNLLSCCILTAAVLEARRDRNFMFICNNHEETGSTTLSGARGNLLLSVLERLYPDATRRFRVLADSIFLSLDNAHATHPNFPEKHEPQHDIALNTGPVLKINASQRYASCGSSNAVFKLLCREIDIPVQEFVMRNDMACGSTIGPMTAAKTGLKTVDIGAATLAMHSIREMTGSRDPSLVFRVIQHFFHRDSLPRIQTND